MNDKSYQPSNRSEGSTSGYTEGSNLSTRMKDLPADKIKKYLNSKPQNYTSSSKLLQIRSLLSQKYLQDGNYEQADQELNQVITILKTELVRLKDLLSQNHGIKCPEDYLKNEEDLDPEAKTALQALESKSIELAKLYMQSSLISSNQKNYPAAKQALQQARQLLVTDSNLEASILCHLGKIHKLEEDYDQAIMRLKEAQRISRLFEHCEEKIANIDFELGIIFVAANQPEQAEISLNQAFAGFSKHSTHSHSLAETLRYLGLNCQAQGKYEDASEYFKQALAIFAKLPDKTYQQGIIHYLLGILYFKQNQHLAAVEAFTTALPILGMNDKRADTFHHLGLSKNELGFSAEALGHWTLAVNQYDSLNKDGMYNQQIRDLRHLSGNTYLAQGKFENAIYEFERILDLYKHLPLAQQQTNLSLACSYHRLGQAYFSSGTRHFHQARIALKQAVVIYKNLNCQQQIEAINELLDQAKSKTPMMLAPFYCKIHYKQGLMYELGIKQRFGFFKTKARHSFNHPQYVSATSKHG